jgi:hypothetical protein
VIEASSFLHVWRNRGDGWRLVLDLQDPVTPPESGE